MLEAAEAAVRAVEGDTEEGRTVQSEGRASSEGLVKTDSAKPSSTLFIRGLHPATTSAELEDVFSEVGPLKLAFVVKAGSGGSAGGIEAGDGSASAAPAGQSNRGIGFVTFALQQDAEKAFESAKPKVGGGIRVRDKLVRVEYAQPKPSRKERATKARDADGLAEGSVGAQRKRKREDAAEQKARKEPKKLPILPRRDPNAPNTVILTGLPSDLTKKALYKKVRKTGDVREVIFPLEDDPSKAVIITSSPFHASTVSKKLDKHIFKGSLVSATVKVKPRSEAHMTALSGPGAITKGSRLIVRNLPFKTTKDTLRLLFEQFGRVLEVDLPTLASEMVEKPSAFPRIRGFAFVWMATIDEANEAIKGANGTTINPSGKPDGGRVIAVDFALSKKEYVEAEKAQAQNQLDQPTNDSIGEENLLDAGDSEDESDEGDHGGDVMDEDDASDDDLGGGSESEQQALPSTDSTIFVRNLLFETTEDSVYQLFRRYGPLRYARITTDYATGRSRGTAFVCFHRQADAEQCLKDAKIVAESSGQEQLVQMNGKNPFKIPSVLSVFSKGDDLQAKFTLDGRILNVTKAVSRDEADELKVQGESSKKLKDKRNTYLMKEGGECRDWS